MRQPVETFWDRLKSADDAGAVWSAVADYAYDAGFSGCSLTMAERDNAGALSPTVLTSFSDAFRDNYADYGLADIDPFLLFSCNDMARKLVVTADLSSFPRASTKHQRFLDIIAEEDATVGAVAVPVETRDAPRFGGWVFSATGSAASLELLESERGREMQLAGALAYERLRAIDEYKDDRAGRLSPRERECLRWLASGMRTSGIADKLNISDSAVNLYIANAKRKLGARTREQAVALAIASGECRL